MYLDIILWAAVELLRVAKGLRGYNPTNSKLGEVCYTSSGMAETAAVLLELLKLFQSQLCENLYGVFTQLSALLAYVG